MGVSDVVNPKMIGDLTAAGMDGVVAFLLLATWKSMFYDQKWVPKRTAAEIKHVRDMLQEITVKLDSRDKAD